MGITFSLEEITCGYHGIPVLSDISFSVKTGEVLSILGPNGVGKTTLFKSMLGLLRPLNGRVSIDDADIGNWSNKKKAQFIGYIPQSHVPPFPYSVRQVVVMGCVAHLGIFSSPSACDYENADRAISQLGISHLGERIYTELSGGERQMVLIARSLAQNPQILLMDEPAANLDYGNQARVLKQIQKLAGHGMIVVMTTHAPDHALLCASKVILIEQGNRVRFGTAKEIVTEENMSRAYGIDVCILSQQERGNLVWSCVPILDGR